MAIVLSVASGKGGVGKTILSANLALHLARAGRRVVLVDLDVGGADVHMLYGLFHPAHTLTDFLARKVDDLDAVAEPLPAFHGLRVITGTGETLKTSNLPYASKQRLIRHVRRLEADVVVADVGAGTNYHALDFFLMADLPVCIATPDPTSILDLYRFVKLAAIRKVLGVLTARGPLGAPLSEADFNRMDEIFELASREGPETRAAAEAALAGFIPHLVLNRVGAKSHLNIAQLRRLLAGYVGVDLPLLGAIPEDPAVTAAVRAYLPVLEAAPASPAARALEEIGTAVAEKVARLAAAA
ncbi:MinD/ParA family protein [Dissulfurirhabdus thermomarina]|uniref:MinD/ParA family protein n=1 Tax=Dissulfurirhabdus thermomarina TaxID=1765737 RepID=A0A6N9TT82_DISTH|nr:P-loop NTPase [Dissulfurirhabdus thermomarina]NDY42954.1 MinD/ParA family protein [Dissulfurirhabdus thermomarina]NMX24332.1 MinD/ParA family protein [Dissulfurirhabdus thermomarina]